MGVLGDNTFLKEALDSEPLDQSSRRGNPLINQAQVKKKKKNETSRFDWGKGDQIEIS